MATAVSIYNMALRQLGAQRISAIDDDIEPARIINDVWENVRNEVLSAHPWNFASVRVALVVIDATPAFDYTYYFQLPDDNLRVIRTEYDIKGKSVAWKIEADRLLIDESSVKILYIKKVTDTSLYSATFVTTLATRLASEIAYPITNDVRLADLKYKDYLVKLRTAKSTDAQEGTTEKIEDSSWIDSRA